MKCLTRIQYFDRFIFTANQSTSNAPTNTIFQSSIWDPDWTGVGGTCYLYSHFAAIYNKYRVHGMKYLVKVQNTNSTDLCSMIICTTPDGSWITNYQRTAEQRNGRLVTIGTNQTGPRTYKGYIPVGKEHGLTKRQMKEDEDFISTMGTNPTKRTFLHFVTNSMQGSTCQLEMEVSLTLYTEFMERKWTY